MATDRTNVVDLARYRRQRLARKKDDLPLFQVIDGGQAPEADDRATSTRWPVETRAPLANRQVAHRRRMLAHLAGAMLSECRN